MWLIDKNHFYNSPFDLFKKLGELFIIVNKKIEAFKVSIKKEKAETLVVGRSGWHRIAPIFINAHVQQILFSDICYSKASLFFHSIV